MTKVLKKQRLANFAKTFSFKKIDENLIIFKRSNTLYCAVFYALSSGVEYIEIGFNLTE